MRKLIGQLAILGMLAACAPIIFPVVKVAIPAGGAQWEMHLQEEAGLQLTLFINGTPIGSAKMPGMGSINGDYQGHTIQALCSQSANDYQGSCVVYVDGSQLATLPFALS